MDSQDKKRHGKARAGRTLNMIYFAHRFFGENRIYYDCARKGFEYYHEETGVWKPLPRLILRKQLQDFVLNYVTSKRKLQPYFSQITPRFISGIVQWLEGECAVESPHGENITPPMVHCANTMLLFDATSGTYRSEPFSPDYYSRNRNPIIYDPSAECPQFQERLLGQAMSPEDIDLLQLFIGMCLLGENIAQKLLILSGTPGGGKSTLVNIIENLVGRWNCTELRTQHLSERFEIGRTAGKSLLTAKDVPADFLNTTGAQRLKALTGNDTMTVEYKNSNDTLDVQGRFNIIITSNTMLRLNFEGDVDAWRRRLLWIRYDRPASGEKITDFDQWLLENEGSGILNWALQGASRLLLAKGQISQSAEQNRRIDDLLAGSNPIEEFVRRCVIPDSDSSICTEDLVLSFQRFCEHMKWPPLSERKIQRELPDAMRRIYYAQKRTDIVKNGTNRRGYKYFKIKTD